MLTIVVSFHDGILFCSVAFSAAREADWAMACTSTYQCIMAQFN
jgi:hypothetical protein